VNRAGFSLLALLSLWNAPVAAQRAGEPTVLLSFSGGLASGPSLWRVAQPICVWMTVPGGYECETGGSGTVNDTLALTRRITTGLAAGLSLYWFASPRIGWRFDLSYQSEAISDRCSPAVPFQPDPDQKNRQACDSFTAGQASLSFVSGSASLIVRPLPTAVVSPYVRVGAGVGLESGETLAAGGAFTANGETLTRQFIQDSSSGAVRPFGTFAIGLLCGSGPATRFGLEAGDLLVPAARVTGPADATGKAPRATRLIHNLSVTLSIAMVLNGRHARRY